MRIFMLSKHMILLLICIHKRVEYTSFFFINFKCRLIRVSPDFPELIRETRIQNFIKFRKTFEKIFKFAKN